ncbi:MAG: hypothetical protein N3E36_04710 [Sulfolobales archaeon]|nr:hypothetical protein [Sulfolobales archaeon]
MEVKHAVGPYPSRRANGYITIVDLVGPPKACPYNCVYCPIKGVGAKAISIKRLVNPDKVLKDFEQLMDNVGGGVRAVLINGMGDPLLNEFFPEIVNSLAKTLKIRKLDAELWIKTTLQTYAVVNKRLNLTNIDRAYVVFDAGSSEDYAAVNEPHHGLKLSTLINYLKNLNEGERVIAELSLVSSGELPLNWSQESLELIAISYSKAGVRKAVVKAIDRPPRLNGIRPAPEAVLRRVAESLTEQGIEPLLLLEKPQFHYSEVVVPSTTDLYSLLLRKPMTITELRRSFRIPYSDLWRAIESLMNRGIVEEVVWRGKIFYRGITS